MLTGIRCLAPYIFARLMSFYLIWCTFQWLNSKNSHIKKICIVALIWVLRPIYKATFWNLFKGNGEVSSNKIMLQLFPSNTIFSQLIYSSFHFFFFFFWFAFILFMDSQVTALTSFIINIMRFLDRLLFFSP